MWKNVLFTLIAIAAFQIIWFGYERLSYKTSTPDSLNRITITPGPVSWLTSIFCTVLCVSFGGMTIQSLAQNDDVLFWILLGPPLTLLMGFGAYIISWTRIRASGACVQHRGLSGWQTIEWDNLIGLLNHSVLGSRLHTINGKPMPVWAYGAGSREMRALFELYEKPFEP